MIEKFYTKTITVLRNVWVDESGYSGSSLDTVGTFKGHIQQVSPELASNLALNYTTSFAIWCKPNTDVKVGDILKCDNVTYSVRLIQDNNFVGLNRHWELVVERQEEVES